MIMLNQKDNSSPLENGEFKNFTNLNQKYNVILLVKQRKNFNFF